MKIVNHTKYPTRVLRTLVCAVHDRLASTEGRLKTWSHLKVEVAYTRRHEASGWAYLSGTKARLLLKRGGVCAKLAAQLVDHEFFHLYGYRHSAFCPPAEQYHAPEAREQFAWAVGLLGETLTERGPKPKATLEEKRAARLEHAEAMLVKWAKKEKTAHTKVVKWRQRVRRLIQARVEPLAMAAAPREE